MTNLSSKDFNKKIFFPNGSQERIFNIGRIYTHNDPVIKEPIVIEWEDIGRKWFSSFQELNKMYFVKDSKIINA